jgi:hypothetical protein
MAHSRSGGTLIGLLAVGVLVGAVPAGAATITADRACYREGQRMNLTANGFPPGSQTLWNVAGEGVYRGGTLNVDGTDDSIPAGDGTFPLRAPILDTGATRATMTISAQGILQAPNFGLNTVTDASTTAQLTGRFTVRAPRGFAGPRARVTYNVSGETELRPLWLHISRYAYSLRRRLLKTIHVPMGTPSPPCGSMTFRTRALGSPHPLPGIYSIDVDDTPRMRPPFESDGKADPEAPPQAHVATIVLPGRRRNPQIPAGVVH